MVISLSSFSQEYSEKNIIDVANSIVNDSNSCVFITLDSNNNPTSRLMDPYIYNNNFEIYLVTNPNSRKVSHIRDDNRITLNFTSKDGGSYVSINGTAKLINVLNLKKTEEDLKESAKLVQFHVYDTVMDEIFAIRDTAYTGIVRAIGKCCIQPVSYTHLTLPTNREV